MLLMMVLILLLLKVSALPPLLDSSCPRRSTYDLVLHVPVELVDLSRGHEVVSSLLQRCLEELELPLHADPLAVHLLRAFPLLTEGLGLALQLLHLLLTHLHLALQDLQEDSLQVRQGECAAASVQIHVL